MTDQKCSTTSLAYGVIIALVAGGIGYFVSQKSGKNDSFSEAQKKEIQKVMLDFLRETPDAFIGAMNDGVQGQQDKIRIELEKAANASKQKLLESGITFGASDTPVVFSAFIDPMCPHCQDFMRLIYTLMQKRQDFSLNIIPVALLGPNSVSVAKIFLAAGKQGVDKFKAFTQKFLEKVNELDRAKLLQLAKDSGLDVAKLEKDETSEEIEKILVEHSKFAEILKIPGVPTIFGGKRSDLLVIIPPMDIDSFSKAVDSIKEAKIDPATAPVAKNKDEK